MYAHAADTSSYTQASRPLYAEAGGSAVFPSLTQAQNVKVAQAYGQSNLKVATLHDLAPAYAAGADSFHMNSPAAGQMSSGQMWDSSFIALVGVLLLALGLRAFYFWGSKPPTESTF